MMKKDGRRNEASDVQYNEMMKECGRRNKASDLQYNE
jgi:hypothetical protein